MNKLDIYCDLDKIKNQDVKQKLSYLIRKDFVKSISCMPDFCDDDFGLNGIRILTEDYILLIGAGFDIGCGILAGHCKIDKNQKKRLSNIKVHDIIDEKETISKEDIRNIIQNPYEWINLTMETKKWYKNLSFNQKVDLNENLLSFNANSILKDFGKIQKGNHFIEIREIEEIYDNSICKKFSFDVGDIFIIIHAGYGDSTKNMFIRYFIEQYRRLQCLEEKNGYAVYVSLDEDLGKRFILYASLAINVCMANRFYLLKKIMNILDLKPNLIFDSIHDMVRIILEDNKKYIEHLKGTQYFTKINDENIAIFPGTLYEEGYIIKSNGKLNYINHGVAEKKTETKVKELREFYKVDNVLFTYNKFSLCHLIAKLSPRLSIKKDKGVIIL